MVNQQSMQKTIRQLVKFKNASDAITDIEILRLVFVRILEEIHKELEEPPRSPDYTHLGLFSDSRSSWNQECAENILDFNLEPKNNESLLDTRVLILGNLFEAFKSQKSRKNRGVYYTPYNLARTISSLSVDAFESQNRISTVSQLLGLKILDNACGSGTFLFAMLEEILRRISAGKEKIVLESIDVETTKLDSVASYLLSKSLFGHDIDEDAIAIAEAQLWLALYSISGTIPSLIRIPNLKVTDTLFSEVLDEKYDIVIGNPPYMRLTSAEIEFKKTIKARYDTTREYNTHALFVQASLSQLKQNGILGYLIHKNLLTLDTFRRLRKSIVKSHGLIHISDCGPGVFRGVTAETAFIILQNRPRAIPPKIRLSRYNSVLGRCCEISTVDRDDYCSLISAWNHRYLLSITSDVIPYLQYLSNLPQLNTLVTIKRGIETGCNRKFISDAAKQGGNWKPLLRGRDVEKFAIKGNVCLNHDVARLAKPGRRDLQEIPKVVVQQNSEHPIAFYDSGNYLVLNSTTYLTDASEDLLKAVCVLLNSNLISWFFKTVLTNNAGLTVNLLPNNLGMIPVPKRLDLPFFSTLCDILTHLRASSDSASFQFWHETLTETLVLGAYFPHLSKDSNGNHRIQEIVDSITSESIGSVLCDKAVNSAKIALKEFAFLQS
ncbi:MAG: Eco57I restriction-modification methylase domain-containing protein [Promethearchaeota archaeon]